MGTASTTLNSPSAIAQTNGQRIARHVSRREADEAAPRAASARAPTKDAAREPVSGHHVECAGVLGFSRIQRHRLPCHREPASSMYGRTRASEGAAQHSQLPPWADEEGCHTA